MLIDKEQRLIDNSSYFQNISVEEVVCVMERKYPFLHFTPNSYTEELEYKNGKQTISIYVSNFTFGKKWRYISLNFWFKDRGCHFPCTSFEEVFRLFEKYIKKGE